MQNPEMEFPTGPNPIETCSYLDKDDINGPGLELYMRRTGDKSIDFGLYKISQYSSSPDHSDRLKFTKELEDLSYQLGPNQITSMLPIFPILVIPNKAEDSIEIKIELCAQLYSLSQVFISEFFQYSLVIQHLIPCLDRLLEDKNQDVIKAACNCAANIAELLTVEDRGSLILTMILRLLHDEEEETRIKALATLKTLISLLSSDVCECFIMKEALILASENVVKVRKAVAECIPRLSKEIKIQQSTQQLIRVFKELSKDSIWGVRKACAENIPEMFEAMTDTIQELYIIPIFLDLLNDKSNSVKQCALLQLGPCIFNCKHSVPEEMVAAFIELSKNSSNKGEFQYHCAFYFPAVLLTLGSTAWIKLSPAFVTLLNEGDSRAKKSLITSMPEVSRILGPELAGETLSPLYEAIFSESSANKQMALSVISRFLQSIKADKRLSFVKYFKVLHKFTASWRIRLVVAEQIVEALELFDWNIVSTEFLLIIRCLIDDKVFKVREAAARALGALIRIAVEKDLQCEVVDEVKEYADGDNFYKKQVFLISALNFSQLAKFVKLFGDEFKARCSEKSSILRILAAKVVKQAMDGNKDYFYWNNLAEKLAHDFDADVRFEISGSYDVERGVPKLVPNSVKHLQLMSPMFRAPFNDDDVEEMITFKPKPFQILGILRASVTPAMNGFFEDVSFESADKTKILIDF